MTFHSLTAIFHCCYSGGILPLMTLFFLDLLSILIGGDDPGIVHCCWRHSRYSFVDPLTDDIDIVDVTVTIHSFDVVVGWYSGDLLRHSGNIWIPFDSIRWYVPFDCSIPVMSIDDRYSVVVVMICYCCWWCYYCYCYPTTVISDLLFHSIRHWYCCIRYPLLFIVICCWWCFIVVVVWCCCWSFHSVIRYCVVCSVINWFCSIHLFVGTVFGDIVVVVIRWCCSVVVVDILFNLMFDCLLLIWCDTDHSICCCCSTMVTTTCSIPFGCWCSLYITVVLFQSCWLLLIPCNLLPFDPVHSLFVDIRGWCVLHSRSPTLRYVVAWAFVQQQRCNPAFIRFLPRWWHWCCCLLICSVVFPLLWACPVMPCAFPFPFHSGDVRCSTTFTIPPRWCIWFSSMRYSGGIPFSLGARRTRVRAGAVRARWTAV